MYLSYFGTAILYIIVCFARQTMRSTYVDLQVKFTTPLKPVVVYYSLISLNCVLHSFNFRTRRVQINKSCWQQQPAHVETVAMAAQREAVAA